MNIYKYYEGRSSNISRYVGEGGTGVLQETRQVDRDPYLLAGDLVTQNEVFTN